MQEKSNDALYTKADLKKSRGSIKTRTVFLSAIAIITVIGLLCAGMYFRQSKNVSENIAEQTVCVRMRLSENTSHPLQSSDVKIIEQKLKQEFPDSRIAVIPVYICVGTYINGKSVRVYAMDKNDSFFIGLEHMLDDTAYFSESQPETIALEVSVLKEEAGGISSDRAETVFLKSSVGVSEKTPILTGIMPGMQEDLICFVNAETFQKIVSVVLEKEVGDLTATVDGNALILLSDIYVYAEDAHSVKSVRSVLKSMNYKADLPTD